MDKESLFKMAQEIKAGQLLQPILVRAMPSSEQYEIVAGERRWQAAQLAGLTTIPALVIDVPDEQALARALIENINHENLNPLEEAECLNRLINECGFTLRQVADAAGRSEPAASRLIQLLSLHTRVQDLIWENLIDHGQAYRLLPFADEIQLTIALHMAETETMLREAEEHACIPRR